MPQTAGCVEAEKDRRLLARVAIVTVDDLIEILHQRHGGRQDLSLGVLPQWRRRLEATGLDVPPAVSDASTTTLLHQRLLDWQEELLHAAYPRRAAAARSGHGSHPRSSISHTRRRHAHPSSAETRRSVLGSRRSRLRHLDPAASTVAPAPQAESASRRANPDGLTDREVAVLRVIAEGLTNTQAARRMFLSEHTVAAHLRSIFRKIGAATRSGATRYALENGLA